MYMWLSIFELTLILFCSFYGTTMNAGFIGSPLFNRTIKKKGSAYLIALGYTDLVITLIVMPTCAVFMIDEKVLAKDTCTILQLFAEISTNTYNLLTLFIAADNYLRSKPGCYLHAKFKDIPPRLIISTLVLISSVIEIVGIYCELNVDYCNHHPQNHQGNLYFRIAVDIFIHFLPAVFSLTAMLKASRRARMPLNIDRAQNRPAEERLHHDVADLNIITYLLYIICWIPCVVVLYVQPDVNSLLFKYALWIGLLRSAFGNSLYIIYNKYFRRGFTALFKFLCCHNIYGFIDHPPEDTPSVSLELPIHVMQPRPRLEPRREEEF